MAFITEVKPTGAFPKKPKEDLLGPIIRKDYTKLEAVVKSFSQKVWCCSRGRFFFCLP